MNWFESGSRVLSNEGISKLKSTTNKEVRNKSYDKKKRSKIRYPSRETGEERHERILFDITPWFWAWHSVLYLG